MNEEELEINDAFYAEEAIGKLFKHNESTFKVDSILGMGTHKIVYKLINIESNVSAYVLKIYRENNSEIFEHSKEKYKEFADHPELSKYIIKGSEYIKRDGWGMIFEPYIEGMIYTSNKKSPLKHPEKYHELIEMFDDVKRHFEAYDICEELIKKYPLQPFYHYFMYRFHLLWSLEDLSKAFNSILICYEIVPDNEHYKEQYFAMKRVIEK